MNTSITWKLASATIKSKLSTSASLLLWITITVLLAGIIDEKGSLRIPFPSF
jgi:hypothetical protein